MTKEIRKEIMNYCLTLLRKSKKVYFEKLNIKKLVKTIILVKTVKTFPKTLQSYVSDIDNKSSKITLAENNIAIADKKKIGRINVQLFHKHYKKSKLKNSSN